MPLPCRFDVSMSDIQTLLLSRPGAAARHHSWWRLHLGACRRVGGCDAAAPAPSPAPSELHVRRELQVGDEQPAGLDLVVCRCQGPSATYSTLMLVQSMSVSAAGALRSQPKSCNPEAGLMRWIITTLVSSCFTTTFFKPCVPLAQTVDFAAWLRRHAEDKDYVVLSLALGEGRDFQFLAAMLADGALPLVDKVYVRWRYQLAVSVGDCAGSYQKCSAGCRTCRALGPTRAAGHLHCAHYNELSTCHLCCRQSHDILVCYADVAPNRHVGVRLLAAQHPLRVPRVKGAGHAVERNDRVCYSLKTRLKHC